MLIGIILIIFFLDLFVIIKSMIKDKIEQAVLFLGQMIIIIFIYMIYLKTF